ncbi:MAG: tRNA (adenosine(37)-N6)-threonylcarbamoyltransferase complex ATPase subunit type 1 TsaE [bacterium]
MNYIPQKLITFSASETKKYARLVSKTLKPGTWLGLTGDLGSGKTTFVQGVAKGLKIDDLVQSPTFVLIREYKGKYNLVHIDLYRLKKGEVTDLGLEDYNLSKKVVVVEWAEKLPPDLRKDLINIHFETVSLNKRKINLNIIPKKRANKKNK